jgi:renalase
VVDEWSVLIVGGGLSGLSAALHLAELDGAAESRILVVEGARSVGGRLATRRMGRATLDHGAQFFTVRSPQFRERVETWLAQGLVTEWCRGFAEVDGYPRYRASGGMAELARHLRATVEDAGVQVLTGHRAAALISDGEGWAATYDGATREPDRAGAVVVTPPVPQTLELLAAGGVALSAEHQSLLGPFGYHRVLALLTVLDRAPGLESPGALQQPQDPTFSFVADNQAKGVSAVPAVTFHTAHALSAQLWDRSDAEVAEHLLTPARQLVAPAVITAHQLKRWRYAGPITPLPEPCLSLARQPGPLVLAGDAFGGSKFEGAYLSGAAAAEAVLAG